MKNEIIKKDQNIENTNTEIMEVSKVLDISSNILQILPEDEIQALILDKIKNDNRIKQQREEIENELFELKYRTSILSDFSSETDERGGTYTIDEIIKSKSGNSETKIKLADQKSMQREKDQETILIYIFAIIFIIILAYLFFR